MTVAGIECRRSNDKETDSILFLKFLAVGIWSILGFHTLVVLFIISLIKVYLFLKKRKKIPVLLLSLPPLIDISRQSEGFIFYLVFTLYRVYRDQY